MKRAFIKTMTALILVAETMFFAVGCVMSGNSQSNDITNESENNYMALKNEFGGKEADAISESFRKYLNAATDEEAAAALVYNTGFDLVQELNITWESDGSYSYTVYLADNKELNNAETFVVTRKTKCDLGGSLIPGKEYYYKVVGETKETKVDSFKLKENDVRPITVDRAHNIRDLGGWKIDGGNIAYGLIYRGGRLNSGESCALSEEGLKTMRDTLGIKTEIDLRFVFADDGGQNKSVLGDDVKYVKASFHGYNYILPEFKDYGPNKRNYYKPSAESLKIIFSALADESNYPVYFHCNAGADRTGTLAFLIEAVLGASEADMTKDFELTSFSTYGARYRGEIDNGRFINGIMQDDSGNFVAFGYFLERMKAVYGGESESINQAVVNYLKTVCGVTDDEISAIRSILTK